MASEGLGNQNPSGHIFMDCAMTGAFRETEKKINRINRQRETGTLYHRPERNPLKAQATPRQDWKIGFEFAPPPAKPVSERWKYPDSDWGLMSKFSSQKKIYDEIFDKQRNYETEVAKFKKMKEENQAKIEAEWEKERLKAALKKNWKEVDDPDAVDIGTGNERADGPDEDMQALNKMIQEAQMHTSRSAVERHKKLDAQEKLLKKLGGQKGRIQVNLGPIDTSKQITQYNMSTLKELQKHKGNHHVLTEWRATRAAKYVNRHEKTAVNPPVYRYTTQEPFRPCGKNILRERSKPKFKSTYGIPTDCDYGVNMTISTTELKTKLAQTEDQIEMQQLKIGLNQEKLCGGR